MPDLQINPLYSAVPDLSEEQDFSLFKLLAFQDNDMKFLPLSLLNVGGGSSWKALAYQISNVSPVAYLHLHTIQSLSDVILFVFRESLSSKLYVSLANIEWDKTTATALDYYDINIISGANSEITTGDNLTLRADAHSATEINGIQRLRIAGQITPAGAFILLLYKGAIEAPAFYIEIEPE